MRSIKVRGLSLKYRVDHFLVDAQGKEHLNLLYYQTRNWGDAINPIFTSKLTSRKIISVDIDAQKLYGGPSVDEKQYLGIGSILHHATPNTIVWGSGLQSPFSFNSRPLEVHAVRGPMTADILRKSGLNCPDIYGDPVLLFPRFYQPEKQRKKYRLGIISHVSDWNSPLIQKYSIEPDVKLINMRKTDLSLIDDIVECENIASSSLHGIILGDAYGLPTVWIKVSNNIPGNDFKFYDYHASIGCSIKEPFIIAASTTFIDIIKKCSNRELDLNLNALIESCPYKDK